MPSCAVRGRGAPRSVNACLAAEAHLEHWSELSAPEDQQYISAPAIRQEVVAAATRSVLDPAFRPVYGWVTAHGFFALFWSVVGDWSAAAVHFRAVGDYDASLPWEYYYGEAPSVYRRHRDTALARG